SHALQRRVLFDAFGERLVAGLQGGLQARLRRRVRAGEDLCECPAGGLTGDRTTGVAAHPIRKDRQQPAALGLGRDDTLARPEAKRILLPRAPSHGGAGGTRQQERHASWTSSLHEKSGPQQGTNSSGGRPLRMRSLALSPAGLSTGCPPRRTRFDLPPCCR